MSDVNNNSQELTVLEPEMEIQAFGSQKQDILELVKKEMKSDQDYGVIPGTKMKTLFQPGAEKLAKFFGLAPQFTLKKEVENINPGASPMFVYYRYSCELIHIASGKKVGDAERSCNSSETNKKSKSVFDLINTCQAMAQKRALVAAVRTATMASSIFSGDDDDQGNRESVSKDNDPVRVKLISRLYAVASDRGFSDETIHKIIKKYNNADSVTTLSNQEIISLTEKFLSEYREVPAGSLPEKYISEEL